jgi:hypothetical protein
MPLALKTEDVADRLRDYARENYLLLANVIKGVVLGSATVTAVGIASHPGHNWQKISPFICSGAATFISYVTWTRGVLLTNSRVNTRDTVLPLVMGGVEVSLFGILNTKGAFPAPWHFWFFLLSLHSLLAVFLVINRIKNTRREDFDPKLRELVYDDYRAWMKKDVIGALVGTFLSFVFGLVTLFLWWKADQRVWFGIHPGDWAILVLPFIAFFFLLQATQRATRQLLELDAKISKELQTPNEPS